MEKAGMVLVAAVLVALAAGAAAAKDAEAVLGPKVWAEVRKAEGGLAKVEALVRAKDRLEGVRLDEEAGRQLGAEVMSGFPWREEYVDSRHQVDLFKLKDLIVGNEIGALSWLFAGWLDHSHPHVRLHGVHRLADLRAKEHTARILGCLEDPDDRVRMGAATALLAFKAGEHAGRIAVLLEDPGERVRKHALTVLGELAGRATVREISGRLSDPAPAVRARAATVLESLGAREALPALRAAAAAEKTRRFALVLESAVRNLEALTGERRAVEILERHTGPKSRIRERSHHVIRSAMEWAELWRRHSEKDVPAIDFEKRMVVAIFKGPGWNSRGVAATVTEDDERVRVRFDDISYQTMGGGDRVTAYGIFVIPRSGETVVLEENVQGLIGEDPIWKERARFQYRVGRSR